MVQKIKGSRQIQSGTITPTELEATAVTPGVYGDTANVPVLTIDADGRVTAASEVAVTGGASVSDGDKGDVTVSGSGAVWTVDNNVVTNAKAADMATDTIKGRATAATGDPEDLAALPFAFTGDVTRPVDSNVQTIANDAVTYAKMQNVSAISKLLGRGSAAGAGDPEEITLGTNLTMAGTTLNAAGGAGSVATDTIFDAKGDLAVGTGADTAARLAVGSNTQVLTADSAEATGLKWAAGGGAGTYPEQATLWSDEFTYTTGAGAITTNVHASQIYQEFIQTTTPANGNAVSGKFFMKAGSYTLRLLTLTGSYLPIYDFYVDGSLVLAGMDCYAAGDNFNVVKTGAVTIATDGQHTLEVRVNGKHASSTNYYIQFTKIWIS